jgi:acetolactate synthase I/II/III large subunit
MNGAQALLRTLLASGVDTCFANPGTSEMHFVAALDQVPEMRGILCLFEGVVTGAADGYGRLADDPAATLLHLGPGLGNGIANLHNARRAHTGIVNVVGDHATHHLQYDAPLTSDIETLARNVSGWIRHSAGTEQVGDDAAEAVAAARAGQVATLVLPADVSWGDGGKPAGAPAAAARARASDEAVAAVARALRTAEPALLLLGGAACQERGLRAAARVAAASGARLLVETFPARLQRGAGLPPVDRLAYLAEFAEAQLAGTRHLVLAGAASPASFFAYPNRASDLVPDCATVHPLAAATDDVAEALERLADALGAPADVAVAPAARPALPTGELTAAAVADAIGALLPERAIISDEAQTSGLWLPGATAGAPAHDVLTLTGGAIGQGLPVAVGAAVACPDRPVIALQADGSAMYTISALWTMAREQLDVTTIVYNNRSYAILAMELQRVGAATDGAKARALLDLSGPDLDFVALGNGMGVPSTRATTAEEFVAQLRTALAEPGPHLIEAVVPSVV